MRKIIIGSLFLSFLGFYSCNLNEDINENSSEAFLKSTQTELPDDNCVETMTFDLIAGQHIDAGSLNISNDDNYIYVEYVGEMDWMISEIHFYMGSAEGIPTNKKGTPVPGHFPYKYEFDSPVTSFSFKIPSKNFDSCNVFLAHAVVVARGMDDLVNMEETAWAGCISFEDYFGITRWGLLCEYCMQECTDDMFLALKTILKDTANKVEKWGVLSDGESVYKNGWCSLMSLVEIEDRATYNLLTEGEVVVGTVMLDIADDILVVTVSSGLETYDLIYTTAFIGTAAELEAYNPNNYCPEYWNFPYQRWILSKNHTLNIPLN